MPKFSDVALMAPLMFGELSPELVKKLKETGKWWVDVLKVGDYFPLFKGAERKPVSLTKGMLKEIEKNHGTYVDMLGKAPPVDVNHATLRDRNGSDTKKRASFPEVRVKGETLQALFNFTALGIREVLDEEAWDSVSGEPGVILDKNTGKEIGLVLTGITLCTRPYLNRLGGLVPDSGAIALSELTDAQPPMVGGGTSVTNKEDPKMDLIVRLSEVLDETITEDQALRMFKEGRAAVDKVATLKEAAKEDKGEITRLSEENSTLTAKVAREEEDRVFGELLFEERITKASAGSYDDPGYQRKVYRREPQGFSEDYRANHAKGSALPGGKTKTATDGKRKSLNTEPMTRSDAADRLNEIAVKGDDYQQAFNEALRDNPDLADAYNGIAVEV